MIAGQSQAFTYDNKRARAMSRATFLVPNHLRDVGALPPATHTSGEWRQFGRHLDGLRRQSKRQDSTARLNRSWWWWSECKLDWEPRQATGASDT